MLRLFAFALGAEVAEAVVVLLLPHTPRQGMAVVVEAVGESRSCILPPVYPQALALPLVLVALEVRGKLLVLVIAGHQVAIHTLALLVIRTFE